jgi:hypothetical protein
LSQVTQINIIGFEIGFVREKRTQFWAKIGFELGLFGFVFCAEKDKVIAISTYIACTYVNQSVFQIGFVLHNFVFIARAVPTGFTG